MTNICLVKLDLSLYYYFVAMLKFIQYRVVIRVRQVSKRIAHTMHATGSDWQTHGTGSLKRIWQNEGLVGRMPGLKCSQELWQVVL